MKKLTVLTFVIVLSFTAFCSSNEAAKDKPIDNKTSVNSTVDTDKSFSFEILNGNETQRTETSKEISINEDFDCNEGDNKEATDNIHSRPLSLSFPTLTNVDYVKQTARMMMQIT